MKIGSAMTNGASHLFWDSCVFYAFLADERATYDVDNIAQYIQEAKNGQHRIYASTLVLAEVTPNAIKKMELEAFRTSLMIYKVQSCLSIQRQTLCTWRPN
jgi:hypothetical protein